MFVGRFARNGRRFGARLFVPVQSGHRQAQTTNPPAPVTLEQINQAMAKADTVFSRFVQERHLSLFTEPLRSEGCLCFQKPGRIRWEIISPYKSILVSDGSGVAQFEWADDQWRKFDLGLADALQNVVSQIAGVMEGRYTSDRRTYAASVTNPRWSGSHAGAAE